MEDVYFNFSSSATPSSAPPEDVFDKKNTKNEILKKDEEVRRYSDNSQRTSSSLISMSHRSSQDALNSNDVEEKLSKQKRMEGGMRGVPPKYTKNGILYEEEKSMKQIYNNDEEECIEDATEYDKEGIVLCLPKHTEAATGCKKIKVDASWLSSHPWTCELLIEHSWLDEHFKSSELFTSNAEYYEETDVDVDHRVASDTSTVPLDNACSAPHSTAFIPAWSTWSDDNLFMTADSAYPMLYRCDVNKRSINSLDEILFEEEESKSSKHVVHDSFPMIAEFGDSLEAYINPSIRIPSIDTRSTHIQQESHSLNTMGVHPDDGGPHSVKCGVNNTEKKRGPSERLKSFLPSIHSLQNILNASKRRRSIEGKYSPSSPDPEYFEWQAKSGGQPLAYTWDRETTPIGYIPPLCNCDNEEYYRLYQLQQRGKSDTKTTATAVKDNIVNSDLKSTRINTELLNNGVINSMSTCSYTMNSTSTSTRPTCLPPVCTNKGCQGLLFVPYSFIEVPLNREIDGLVPFAKLVPVPSDTELYCANTKHTLILVTRSPEHEYLCWKALELKGLTDSSLIFDVDQSKFKPYAHTAVMKNVREGDKYMTGSLTAGNAFNGVATSFAIAQQSPEVVGDHRDKKYGLTTSVSIGGNQRKNDEKMIRTISFAPHRRMLNLRLRDTKRVEGVMKGGDSNVMSCRAAAKTLIEEITLPSETESEEGESCLDGFDVLDKQVVEDNDLSYILKTVDALIAKIGRDDGCSISEESAASITEEELEELAIGKSIFDVGDVNNGEGNERVGSIVEVCEDTGLVERDSSCKHSNMDSTAYNRRCESTMKHESTSVSDVFVGSTNRYDGGLQQINRGVGEQMSGVNKTVSSTIEASKSWSESPLAEHAPLKSILKTSTPMQHKSTSSFGNDERTHTVRQSATILPSPRIVDKGVRPHDETPYREGYNRGRQPCLLCGSREHTVDDGCTSDDAISTIRIHCAGKRREEFSKEEYLLLLCDAIDAFFKPHKSFIYTKREECKIVDSWSSSTFLLPINKPLPREYENGCVYVNNVGWVFKSCAEKYISEKHQNDKFYKRSGGVTTGFASRRRYIDSLASPTGSRHVLGDPSYSNKRTFSADRADNTLNERWDKY